MRSLFVSRWSVWLNRAPFVEWEPSHATLWQPHPACARLREAARQGRMADHRSLDELHSDERVGHRAH